MKRTGTVCMRLALLAGLGVLLGGCGEPGSGAEHGHTHTAGDASHDEGERGDAHGAGADSHEHDEVSLEPVSAGGMSIEVAQGHGGIGAGKESQLVVKLPYSDGGQTIVRAWLGTEDRTLSYVGRGAYAPSHDDYDIHAVAPDPLPADAMWWIEIEKPDGTKVVGSATPIME